MVSGPAPVVPVWIETTSLPCSPPDVKSYLNATLSVADAAPHETLVNVQVKTVVVDNATAPSLEPVVFVSTIVPPELMRSKIISSVISALAVVTSTSTDQLPVVHVVRFGKPGGLYE